MIFLNKGYVLIFMVFSLAYVNGMDVRYSARAKSSGDIGEEGYAGESFGSGLAQLGRSRSGVIYITGEFIEADIPSPCIESFPAEAGVDLRNHYPYYETEVCKKLMDAAKVADNIEFVACLRNISSSRVSRIRDEQGRTILHYVALNDNYKTIFGLKRYCGKEWPKLVNVRDIKDQTALHLAAGNGSGNAVSALIMFHANKVVRDLDGKTPLYYALIKYKHGYLLPWISELR